MTKCQKAKTARYVLDANILIDYAKVDMDPIRLFSEGVGELMIPDIVFYQEVDNLSEKGAKDAGIRLYEVFKKEYDEAMSLAGESSTEDMLCYILAKKEGAPCITNDKRLRHKCAKAGIKTIWGLEIMLILCKEGIITSKSATLVAFKIQEINRRYITKQIMDDFQKKLAKLDG